MTIARSLLTLLVLAGTALYVASSIQSINVALHAQVAPAAEKVVGSVITTDGLKAAFLQRPEVGHVRIFYPMQYAKLFDHSWDLVVIEGWFPAIGDFIQMARVNNREAIVLFFCLDPSYPGMDVVSSLDIDGLLTNSVSVQSAFQGKLPTQFVMLAADPLQMAPAVDASREWGAVYIGAGGGMVNYKYMLLSMLHSALCCGLRLHGSHWDEIPVLREVWQGPLPRGRIAEAYSSAHTVLASTTDDQRASGMINNRVFEALSCGGVVISERNPAVVATFGDVVRSITDGADAGDIIKDIVANADSEYVSDLRRRGRESIVRQHTWHHRVVSILDLFHHIRSAPGDAPFSAAEAPSISSLCGHRPRLAWIVSRAVEQLTDYFLIRMHVRGLLAEHYCVVEFGESEWVQASAAGPSGLRTQFDVLMAHVYIYDKLDSYFQQHMDSAFGIRNGSRIQKTIGYVYGVSSSKHRPAHYSSLAHYDAIWHRCDSDIADIATATRMNLPEIRLQRVFGVGLKTGVSAVEPSLGFRTVGGDSDKEHERAADTINTSDSLKTVVMCVFAHREVCATRNIEKYTGQKPYLLLLVGGLWTDWMADDALFGFDEVDVRNQSSVAGYLNFVSRAVHVSEGRIGQAVQYIANADEFLYMSGVPADSLNRSAGDSFVDTIWPFVAAAVGYTKIRLTEGDTHTIRRVYKYAGEALSTWDLESLSRSIRIGIARLVGLSSHKSNLRVTYPVNSSLWMGTTETLQHSNSETLSLNYRIEFDNMVLGRDGQGCVSINGAQQTCLLRPTKHLGAVLKWDRVSLGISFAAVLLEKEQESAGSAGTCPNIAGWNYLLSGAYARAIIAFSLRGTVFSESAHSSNVELFVPVWLKYFCPAFPSHEDMSKVASNEKINGISGVLLL